MGKRLLVIAGPNGSGKSTITNMIRKDANWHQYIYLSPDEVIKGSEYASIQDELTRYRAAMGDCQRMRNQVIANGLPLAFETVFSTEEKLDFLVMAKSEGYEINVIFVTTADPAINIARVSQRVEEGGHDVPPDKIVARYEKSMNFLCRIFEIADYFSLYDNSGDFSFPVFYKEKDVCYDLNIDSRPKWLDKHFASQLSGEQQALYKWYSLPREQTILFVKQPNSRKIGLINPRS